MLGLESITPKFCVPSSRIRVLYEPRDFYNYLCKGILSAKSRVYLASLYLGSAEQEFVDVIDKALQQNDKLKVYVLVDALRGTREAPHTCSASLLSPLAASYPHRVRLALYKTPKLNWITSKFLPKRIIEGVGLQHMKLYGFDDEIVLSGANLSNDYFTNRQDRYISIKDAKVSNWFFNVHQNVSRLSQNLLPANNEQRFVLNPPTPLDVAQAKTNLKQLLKGNLGNQGGDLPPASMALENDSITEVYPVCQFTPLKIGNEHKAMLHVTNRFPQPSTTWIFTAGYFNVEPQIGQRLADANDGQVILASAEANGFYQSKGLSGLIPRYYSILASEFFQQIPTTNNIRYSEWRRGTVNTPNGWSYHAKGLWIMRTGSKYPWMTYIGSSNFTRRSYQHDLECGAFLVTQPRVTSTTVDNVNKTSEEPNSLMTQLQKELSNIQKYCSEPENCSRYPNPKPKLRERILLRLFGDRL